MNSWDNPSTAPFAAGKPSLFLAWGQQTANHANTFLDIPKEKYLNLGQPNLKFTDNPQIDKDEFCKLHDINPTKKYFCMLEEVLELMNLNTESFEKAIESGKFDDLNIIYRPHLRGAVTL